MDENQNLDLSDDEKKLFEDFMPEDLDEILDTGVNRRHFLKLVTLAGGGLLAAQSAAAEQLFTRSFPAPSTAGVSAATIENGVNVSLKVNGTARKLMVDSRMTLLDTLRERLELTGSKKGCDHGQCGACTVIVNGHRVLSCLTLAASCEGKTVQTIEGLAKGSTLHPMQEAFLKHDGFQCGFCTPGQICSAVALLDEARKGDASYVTEDVRKKTGPVQLSTEEIRERMSGNLCRCGAYPNIVAAIQEVHSGKPVEQTFRFSA
ncbi:2Fe-2S iron-sulfur cluster-binding protein [Spirosoma utsteinense]|uniref:Xanthine dehydrogenase YagT iron-sulfur-binding subunit n=1 Tax=Spirosoma utsteinense TaxID=2585773 RepID=A0ABR6VZV0_9BACT|nr:2Fe-2S iron-sulfur cluster-binding protein [Spirosoma utsteinense]MBC3786500.1 xanthine dehydrogenase YagT iron-sulfur-binding subunit [Spirosoma utsteinense]MBC3789876.1 xanthine dehydrogenase YagT iron-sulfur-binding subunit [Spirosoma utsteinense]